MSYPSKVRCYICHFVFIQPLHYYLSLSFYAVYLFIVDKCLPFLSLSLAVGLFLFCANRLTLSPKKLIQILNHSNKPIGGQMFTEVGDLTLEFRLWR